MNDFRPAAGRAFTRGLMIQGLQAGAVLCLARALSAEASAGLALVFLASSLAAAVPVTMGGMGARELVFFWAAPHVCLDSTVTVAIALLFFIITLISSLPGMYFHWLPQRL
ncbi:lysylphosphatidylglycerol synthase domain-containing protein [uncultured Desulfobacter sp.]|uniref:lysylphosphatidylglycerol synthase domain-containing protein n=1 Tax=uncultured Desulfobacter sp. TaxID=240139 RepID=UPI002AAC2E92|nr:lysylphosphatidylglycerol synthase domain-containing protein [uncultured Desulfobacter sp.]